MPEQEKNGGENTAKRLKFKELAEARTNRALDEVRKIGNLSNRQMYEWEEGEIRKISKALREAVAEVEAKFLNSGRRGGNRFTL
jgi:acyl-homoserine lactone acylase PvdQ